MAGRYVEELVAFLGWEVDSKELTQFEKQVESTTKIVKGMAVAVGAVATATAGYITLTNQATARNKALADSVGVSATRIKALSEVLKPTGFDFERVVDLAEELNNKMGESTGLNEPMIAVAEATKILGLEYKKLSKLSPEEQFTEVLDAALKLEDHQKAVSAVDILMGTEANRIVGYLRSQNKELATLVEEQLKLNFLTEEGWEGALAFVKALGGVTGSIKSIGQEIAGLVGGELAKTLEGWKEWIRNNRTLVKVKITEWVDRITRGIKWLWKWMVLINTKTEEWIDRLGGLHNILKMVKVAIGAMIATRAILMIGSFVKAVQAATLATTLLNAATKLTPLLLFATIALIGLIIEDLYHFFTGGESFFGMIGDKIAEFAHMNVRPFIATMLGMTPEEFDMALVRIVRAVTTFFTKTIPGVWEEGVKIVEGFYGDLFNFIDYWMDLMYERTIGDFKRMVAEAKGLLSQIPGASSLLGINDGTSEPNAGLRHRGAFDVATLSSISNNSNSNQNVQVNAPITVTAQDGQNAANLANEINTRLSRHIQWAINSNDSGRDI